LQFDRLSAALSAASLSILLLCWQVKDVKLITDNKTRRSKGIAYVEFVDVASVALAMGLNNQKLLGVPILVQQSQAEKNRAAGQATMNLLRGQNTGPMRLYVGSLHFNIDEDMLRGIFEPFGRVSSRLSYNRKFLIFYI